MYPLKLKNRIVRSATWEALAKPDGSPSQELIEVYRELAAGGRGGIITGFDGVQIHAAHGFYLNRFISPAHNHRSDQYGGDTAGRARILLAVLQAIRAQVPDLHVTVKISCSDFMYGGLLPSEALKICLLLVQAGIDSIEVSDNGTSVAGIRAGQNEAYFLHGKNS